MRLNNSRLANDPSLKISDRQLRNVLFSDCMTAPVHDEEAISSRLVIEENCYRTAFNAITRELREGPLSILPVSAACGLGLVLYTHGARLLTFWSSAMVECPGWRVRTADIPRPKRGASDNRVR